MPGRVPAGGFYFCDLGPKVSQYPGAEGCGYVVPKLEYLDTLEGFHPPAPGLDGKENEPKRTKAGWTSTSRDTRATSALPGGRHLTHLVLAPYL